MKVWPPWPGIRRRTMHWGHRSLCSPRQPARFQRLATISSKFDYLIDLFIFSSRPAVSTSLRLDSIPSSNSTPNSDFQRPAVRKSNRFPSRCWRRSTVRSVANASCYANDSVNLMKMSLNVCLWKAPPLVMSD